MSGLNKSKSTNPRGPGVGFYPLVVLLNLPLLSGFGTCRCQRLLPQTPIIWGPSSESAVQHRRTRAKSRRFPKKGLVPAGAE